MRSEGCPRALAALLFLLGCAPVVAVQRPVPAEIDLGPRVRTLTLVAGQATPEAAAQGGRPPPARPMRPGHFRLRLWSEGMAADPSGRTGYLSIEVAEWIQEEARAAEGLEERARVRLLTRMGRTPGGPWSEPYESGASVTGVVFPTEEKRPQLLAGA